jgi:hypothetical protein
MKQKLALVAATFLVIGIGLIFVAKTLHLESGAIVEAIAKFQPIYWFGALVAVLFQTVFQINRLWILFPKEASLQWIQAARAFSYGQFINTFGPTGAGDLLKVFLTKKNKDKRGRKVEASESTAIVLVVDKLADVGSVIFLILIALYQTSFKLPELNWTEKVKTILLVATLLCLVLYIIVVVLRTRSSAIAHWLKGFKTGLQAMQEPKRLSGSLLMGMGNWLSELGALQILCIAQGLPLSYPELILALVILNIGISVPISLANLGVYEASLAFALIKFGVPATQGLAIATAHHVSQMIGTALWALAFWLYQRWQDWNRNAEC